MYDIFDLHGAVFMYPGSYITKPRPSPPAVICLNADASTAPSLDTAISYSRPVLESRTRSVPAPPPGVARALDRSPSSVVAPPFARVASPRT